MMKKHNLLNRRHEPMSKARKAVFAIAFVIMLLYCLMILFFFLYGFLLSFKSSEEITTDVLNDNLFSWPKQFTLQNYVDCFNQWQDQTGYTYWETLWNSIWRTVLSSFLTWFTTALVCYVCVHYQSKFTKFIYLLGLLITMIPLYGTQGAAFKLYKNLGLINSPWINIVSITLYGAYFFYMYAFWKKIPHAYVEAAEIDGANHYQIFFKVMLPQAMPSLFALYIMQFISAWNDYESTAAYMFEYPNLSYGTYVLSEQAAYNSAVISMYFAGVILGMLPVLVIFIIFQNSIMEKVHLGGLKG